MGYELYTGVYCDAQILRGLPAYEATAVSNVTATELTEQLIMYYS